MDQGGMVRVSGGGAESNMVLICCVNNRYGTGKTGGFSVFDGSTTQTYSEAMPQYNVSSF